MTPKRIHDLAAGAATKRFRSEGEMDRWLQDQQIRDPETRISLKIQLMAQGLATDQPLTIGRMATDDVAYRPGLSEIDRLLTKLGTDLSGYQRLTERELDAKLREVGITDPTERIALKTELVSRKLIAPPRPSVQASRTRSMTAAAERSRPVLTDRQGRPLVLRSHPA